MAEDLTIDYLIVARQKDPPPEITLIRALASANLGMAVFAPPGPRSAAAPVNRDRMGTYTISVPKLHAQARIAVYRYLTPVTADMGEAAFVTLTRGLSPTDVAIARSATLAYDLRLSTPRAEAAQALGWNVHVLRVVLETIDGVVIDPAAQRCYGKADLARLPLHTPLAHVAIHDEGWDAESRWLHTHGLQKFGRPELDLVDVPEALKEEALAFLRDLVAQLASGAMLVPGQEVHVDDTSGLVALAASSDPDHQAPYGRLQLADMPLPGERQSVGVRRFLTTMALAEAERRAAQGNRTGALQVLDQLLVASPDDCAALALKAQLLLQAGQMEEALTLGELMDVRFPSDVRGPLTLGAVLAAQGRYSEALHALNEAIRRDPDAREAFALRSQVYARMGEEKQASADRARAAYLGV